jgi:hypothetical protein
MEGDARVCYLGIYGFQAVEMRSAKVLLKKERSQRDSSALKLKHHNVKIPLKMTESLRIWYSGLLYVAGCSRAVQFKQVKFIQGRWCAVLRLYARLTVGISKFEIYQRFCRHSYGCGFCIC